MAGPRILVVGTADTKGTELQFVAGAVADAGGRPILLDIGTGVPECEVDITADMVLAGASQDQRDAAASGDRGQAMAAMAEALGLYLGSAPGFDGVIAAGGGGGTAVATAGMRAMPLGLPKLMVTTMASVDVSAYVGISDIMMVPAITDIAGLNRISRQVLTKAARAVVAMAAPFEAETGDLPAVGLTMFGVTTPCVTSIAEDLDGEVEPVVFHATGAGGRTMEALIGAGMLTGCIDMTTTEIADHLVGGVLSAGPDRLGAAARAAIPVVVSVGACDMVNFQAPETVPERFKARQFYRHNPQVTLMRTTPDECRQIGGFIAEKLNAHPGPVIVLIPERGVSALDIEGGAFRDPQADTALFTALEQGLDQTDTRRIERHDLHINDPQFALAATAAWREIAGRETP